MYINILICDSNKKDVLKIHDCLEKYQFQMDINFNIKCFFDANKMLNFYNNTHNANIIIMEKLIGGIDGIDIAKEIRKNSGINTLIIFYSRPDSGIVNCFDVQPFSFIKKPLNIDELFSCMTRALKFLSSYNTIRLITHDYYERSTYLVPLNDVVSIHTIGCKHDLLYKLIGGHNIKARGVMKNLDFYLSDFGFLRISRNAIINLRYLKCIKDTDVILTTGDVHSISNARLRNIHKMFKFTLLKTDGSGLI